MSTRKSGDLTGQEILYIGTLLHLGCMCVVPVIHAYCFVYSIMV